MKLSEWARKIGISYRRAWQMFKDGKLPNARQLPTGTIVVIEDEEEKRGYTPGTVAILILASDVVKEESLPLRDRLRIVNIKRR
jgi:hypothetical protein